MSGEEPRPPTTPVAITTAEAIARSERQISRSLALWFVLIAPTVIGFILFANALPRWYIRDPSLTKNTFGNWQGSQLLSANQVSLTLCPAPLSPATKGQQYLFTIANDTAQQHDEYARLQAALAADPTAEGYMVYVEWSKAGIGLGAPNMLATVATLNVLPIAPRASRPVPFVSLTYALSASEHAAISKQLAAHWQSTNAPTPPRPVREWALLQTKYSYSAVDVSWWPWGTFLNILAGALALLALAIPYLLLVSCFRFYRVGKGWKRLTGTACAECKYPLEWLKPSPDGLLRCPECGTPVDLRSPIYPTIPKA